MIILDSSHKRVDDKERSPVGFHIHGLIYAETFTIYIRTVSSETPPLVHLRLGGDMTYKLTEPRKFHVLSQLPVRMLNEMALSL